MADRKILKIVLWALIDTDGDDDILFPQKSRWHTLRFVLLVGAVFCFCGSWLPHTAQAQEVAILKSADLAAYNQAVDAFKTHLPGKLTPTIEYDLQGDLSRGRRLARRIRASDVDIVLAVGLKAALVAKLEILDIPVIFCMVLHPAKYDLDAPNMVGIALEVPFNRQIDPMRSVLPNLKRIGVLYDPNKTSAKVESARRQAKAMGVELIAREVSSEREVPEALRSLVPHIQALWLLPDSTVLTEESLAFLLSTTLAADVPVIGFSSGLVRSGALVGAHIMYEDVGKQAARLAKRLANSGSSSPTGIIPPKQLRLSINLKTAKYLGITVPPKVLNTFDEQY